MIYFFMAAWSALFAIGLARYLTYILRSPAKGLHDWLPRSHHGMYGWKTMLRCRRCHVWVSQPEEALLPPDCAGTKDFLAVRDVMES